MKEAEILLKYAENLSACEEKLAIEAEKFWATPDEQRQNAENWRSRASGCVFEDADCRANNENW